MAEKFTKLCPKCGDEQSYSTPQNYYKALKRNRQCRKCMYNSKEYRKKHEENMKKLWENEHHKKHMNDVHTSDDYKKKRRIISQSIIKNRFGKGNIANVNKSSCEFIDKLNIKLGLKLQHGLNGGEFEVCGYSIDGYDKEKNIVFEYDEPRHYNVNDELKKDDVIRQENIIKELKPIMFIRYNERINKLVDVLTRKEIL